MKESSGIIKVNKGLNKGIIKGKGGGDMAGVGKGGEVKYGNVLRNSRGSVGNIFEELKESEIELDISNDL